MALTANVDVSRPVDQQIREFPVAASVQIYRGALVGMDPAGMCKPFVPGDDFIGLSYEQSDNSSGAAGAKKLRVFVQSDFVFALSGVTDKDAGKAVYATGDDTIALVGHPDAFVGRILHKDVDDSDSALIRLKQPGSRPSSFDRGSIEIVKHFGSPITETGNNGGGTPVHSDGLRLVSALGLGVRNVAGAGGGADLEFDAVAEIAQASIETPDAFLVSAGVTFEARLHLPDIGDSTTLDIDWGLVAAITANSRADMDHADATDLALFHMDGNAADILAQSDNNTIDVPAADTTIDNVTTAGAYKDFKVIGRPDGTCEFWIDRVRVLSSTAFAVRTTAVLAGIINIEKTSNDTLAKVRVERFRVAGARS